MKKRMENELDNGIHTGGYRDCGVATKTVLRSI